MDSNQCGNPDCGAELDADASYCVSCRWKRCGACGNWSWTYVCPKCGNRSPTIPRQTRAPKQVRSPKQTYAPKQILTPLTYSAPKPIVVTKDPCCISFLVIIVVIVLLPIIIIVVGQISYLRLPPDQRLEVDRIAEERDAELDRYGPEPHVGEVTTCLRSVVNDPDSLIVENALDRLITSHAEYDGTSCWKVAVSFRAKNQYGGYLRESGTLYIKNGNLVGYESSN